MTTDTALHILVIILSVTLFISLVISIVAGVFIIKFIKTLRQIADKGEHLVDSAEATVNNIRHNVSAAGLLHSFTQVVKFMSNVKKGKK
jgi:biopolymer transport protein ExbB/TolQ